MQVTLPGLHEDSVTAELPRGLHVRQTVADPPGALQIDVQRPLRLVRQPESRLATIAGPRELRMVGTVVRAVDMGAVRCEYLAEPALHRAVGRGGGQAAREARLIRHDDDEKASIVEPFDCAGSSREQLHLRALVQKARVF